ncbi:Glucose/arabinose dehydrogenase, beta-propeller fold [Sphingomonas sp. NFR04]|uniref:PQQ-dependent sugar dehydrogenase n=1 Tax=Sphingomonas sp. NFR04 TaxID=1566283 RepID=UPI0008E27621|nr:PQQ-dependent sugar dehydrogenase [Sphingomonas sp. NFR04]SFK16451.1 Glucose/arabinose dehydrogenase, beta-propeller fold [Sphingomonas sp. NFR04]
MKITTPPNRATFALLAAILLASCGGGGSGTVSVPGQEPTPVPTPTSTPTPEPTPDLTLKSTGGMVTIGLIKKAELFKPYAVAPLATGQALIVGVKDGLRVLSAAGVLSDPIPTGQNIYFPFDVLPAPDFETSGRIYITYAEMGPDRPESAGKDDGRGDGANLAVMSGKLDLNTNTFTEGRVIWRQSPRVTALGEFGARLRFSPDGRYLFVTAGDRSTYGPQQQLDNTLGKTVRLYPDGSIPPDNPFVGQPGAMGEIWTLGHRNHYGLDFDTYGTLWSSEHGPEGGDELNVLQRGGNYGWPNVSYGNHYTGEILPKPKDGDGYVQSALTWTPAIAPSGMTIYKGTRFANLRGVAVIGGLKGQVLVFATLGRNGSATEMDRVPMGFRVRDVRSAADGALWVVEDAESGRIFRVIPAK